MKVFDKDLFQSYERLKIQGKSIWVPQPVDILKGPFIGRNDILERAVAAWTSLDGFPPLNFRLYGPPGVGKNAIIYELARILEKDLYIINGHEELGPEDIAINLLPSVCSLVVKKSDTFLTFTVTPSDAACLSAFLVNDHKEKGHPIDLECIDDSNFLHYHQEYLRPKLTAVKDDYLVFVEGLERYFSPLMKQLDCLWNKASEEQRFFTRYRAGIVAERLKHFLSQGKKTLFVCDYNLWWRVSKELAVETPLKGSTFVSDWMDVKAMLVLEDPYQCWVRGILDDFPIVVSNFYTRVKSHDLDSFDKLEEIEKVIKNTIAATQASPSIRKVHTFFRYLRNTTAISSRLTPDLVSHVHQSANICVGKAFAKEPVKALLEHRHLLEGRKDNLNHLKRYAAITSRPERFQCRIAPDEDPELMQFSPNELGLAWAIKYADKAVLVVARDGWKPSKGIFQFAKERRVMMIQVPLLRLSRELVKRMQSFHLISTELKKHPIRDSILERFIE